MKKLTEQEIKSRLEEIDGWTYEDNAIYASYDFQNFKDAFSFMVRVSYEAEAQQHHPDWSNVYNQLDIKLSTHDAGGVTQKDLRLAQTIVDLLGA